MNFLKKFMNWLGKGQVSAWKATNAELDRAVTPDLKAGRTHPHQSRDGGYSGIQVKLPLPEECE